MQRKKTYRFEFDLKWEIMMMNAHFVSDIRRICQIVKIIQIGIGQFKAFRSPAKDGKIEINQWIFYRIRQHHRSLKGQKCISIIVKILQANCDE